MIAHMRPWLALTIFSGVLGCAHRQTQGKVTSAGYDGFETGVSRRLGGVMEVRALTRMPGATPEQVRWWFSDYMETNEHYRRWHPTAHVSMAWEDKVPGELIGATHVVRESIGDTVFDVRVRFVEPSVVLGSNELEPGSWAACALTGPADLDFYAGTMCHIVRPTPWGAEMRSVFWMGRFSTLRGETRAASFGSVMANTPWVRRALVHRDFAEDLMEHALYEMGYLSDFLPELYAENQD